MLKRLWIVLSCLWSASLLAVAMDDGSGSYSWGFWLMVALPWLFGVALVRGGRYIITGSTRRY